MQRQVFHHRRQGRGRAGVRVCGRGAPAPGAHRASGWSGARRRVSIGPQPGGASVAPSCTRAARGTLNVKRLQRPPHPLDRRACDERRELYDGYWGKARTNAAAATAHGPCTVGPRRTGARTCASSSAPQSSARTCAPHAALGGTHRAGQRGPRGLFAARSPGLDPSLPGGGGSANPRVFWRVDAPHQQPEIVVLPRAVSARARAAGRGAVHLAAARRESGRHPRYLGVEPARRPLRQHGALPLPRLLRALLPARARPAQAA
jgi:hypothetical protein